MRGLFKDNLPLAEFVLRIITGKQDLVLLKCEIQADMKLVTGARSVCLDAYATDSMGRKYDIEAQRSVYGADPHCARYHSSMMDVENLDENHDYKELPDTYVIFITEKDYYQAGKAVYMIRNMNQTLNQPFGDGAHILYVNGEYRDDSAIGKLMHDFNCADADDMHYGLLAERTRYLKENSKGVNEMYRTMDEVEKECYEEGRETQAELTAINLRKLGLPLEQIAHAVGFHVEKVEKWVK